MADEPKTDGTGSATGTQTPGAKTATDSGNALPAGVQARIDGLIAEKGRFKDENAALQKQIEDLKAQHQTEDEKRIAAAAKQIVEAEYGPRMKRLDSLETFVKSEADALISKIPEAHRGAIDTTASPEVQLRQARVFAEITGGQKTTTRISGGGNPDGQDGQKPTYTLQQWREFQSLAGSFEPKDRAKFYGMQEEMYAARREGRIVGLS